MRKHLALAVLLAIVCSTACRACDFVPDRMSNPDYAGPSRLSGQVDGSSVRTWGTNAVVRKDVRLCIIYWLDYGPDNGLIT